MINWVTFTLNVVYYRPQMMVMPFVTFSSEQRYPL